jgi:alpha-amylase
MGPFGCVLVKDCSEQTHRDFEVRLFKNPNGVGDNDNEWPIRFVLSSYYGNKNGGGVDAIPDGYSDCSLCTVTCGSCKHSVSYSPAYVRKFIIL